MKKHKIIQVFPDSIAEELDIEPGDYLLTINEKEIEDIFDYQFGFLLQLFSLLY